LQGARQRKFVTSVFSTGYFLRTYPKSVKMAFWGKMDTIKTVPEFTAAKKKG
jgi:hypothetical protein